MTLRPFGTTEADLAIDFGARDRASLVTRLLAGCALDASADVAEDTSRALSEGKRVEHVIALAAGGADEALSLAWRCGACGEELEFELTVEEVRALQHEADAVETVTVESGGERLSFRKPTGRDLEAWARMTVRDEREAAVRMIGGLAIGGPSLDAVSEDTLRAIESALDEADPLIDFKCDVGCGACGERTAFSVDLMETALGMLRRGQTQLVVSLHRLASHYHWTERDIFAVPDWRRQQYLQLIAASVK